MSMSVRSLSVFAGAALVAASACVTTANAQVLLTVDITNPSAAMISTTGAAAAASSSGSNYSVRLDGFFLPGTPNNLTFASASTLRSSLGNNVLSFTYWFGVNNSLRLSTSAGTTQTFVAGQQAFTGSLTSNISFGQSRAVGYVGDIYVVGSPNSVETGIVIGQYQIVPAPTTAAAMGLLALTATARRRRR
jgi:hypothetical protein